MTNLYIDTSDSQKISVRLTQNDQEFAETGERERKAQITLELIKKLLKKSKTKLEDIDYIYVKRGPGSYTGLKVGVSIANALSFALEIPVNDKKVGEIEEPTY